MGWKNPTEIVQCRQRGVDPLALFSDNRAQRLRARGHLYSAYRLRARGHLYPAQRLRARGHLYPAQRLRARGHL